MLANLTIFLYKINIKSREFGPAGSLNTGSQCGLLDLEITDWKL